MDGRERHRRRVDVVVLIDVRRRILRMMPFAPKRVAVPRVLQRVLARAVLRGQVGRPPTALPVILHHKAGRIRERRRDSWRAARGPLPRMRGISSAAKRVLTGQRGFAPSGQGRARPARDFGRDALPRRRFALTVAPPQFARAGQVVVVAERRVTGDRGRRRRHEDGRN